MSTSQTVLKQQQLLARYENALAIEKLKKRRADTRRKIELGGLVIKAGMNGYNKAVILGSLLHAIKMLQEDQAILTLFESAGENCFNEA